MPEGVDLVAHQGTKSRRGGGTGKGDPGHIPTEPYRHTVSVLRANGAAEETIARLLRMKVDTLRKHYPGELKDGRETITAALGSIVVNAGLNGNVHAALSWLGRFGGEEWKKSENRLHGGIPGAAPIGIEARSRVVIVLPDNGRPTLTPGEVVE